MQAIIEPDPQQSVINCDRAATMKAEAIDLESLCSQRRGVMDLEFVVKTVGEFYSKN